MRQSPRRFLFDLRGKSTPQRKRTHLRCSERARSAHDGQKAVAGVLRTVRITLLFRDMLGVILGHGIIQIPNCRAQLLEKIDRCGGYLGVMMVISV